MLRVGPNNNVPGLRNLLSRSMQLGKTFEQLSTALRINNASDDAAGLSISENLRAQIGGLRQSVINAQDSLAMISTAESSIDSVSNILQRMRTLAIGAANDPNNAEAYQDEINSSLQELRRIAGQTQYAQKNLLNGSLTNTVNVQSGYLGKGVTLSPKAAFNLAGEAVISINQVNEGNVNLLGTNSTNASNPQNVTLSGGVHRIDVTNVKQEAAQEVTSEQLTTAAGVASAATLMTEVTNIAGSIEVGDTVRIAGTDREGNPLAGELTVNAGTTVQDLTDEIQNVFGAEVTVTFNAEGNIVVEDNQNGDSNLNVSLDVFGASGLKGELTTEITTAGSNYEALVSLDNGPGVEVIAGETATLYNNAGEQITLDFGNFQEGYDQFYVEEAQYAVRLNGGEVVNVRPGQQNVFLTDANGNAVTIDIGAKVEEGQVVVQGSQGALNFHIGPNAGASLLVPFPDLNPENLGLASQNGLSVADINVTTASGAEQAINILDTAIGQVTSYRSELGAVGNELDHTINQLNQYLEDIQSSESRIRDLDMAKGMMDLIRNQLLQETTIMSIKNFNVNRTNVLQLLS